MRHVGRAPCWRRARRHAQTHAWAPHRLPWVMTVPAWHGRLYNSTWRQVNRVGSPSCRSACRHAPSSPTSRLRLRVTHLAAAVFWSAAGGWQQLPTPRRVASAPIPRDTYCTLCATVTATLRANTAAPTALPGSAMHIARAQHLRVAALTSAAHANVSPPRLTGWLLRVPLPMDELT